MLGLPVQARLLQQEAKDPTGWLIIGAGSKSSLVLMVGPEDLSGH